MKISLFLVDT